MISRTDWEEGLKKEKVHQKTYAWLKAYVKTYKVLPKETDFYLHLVEDNLQNDKNFYKEN